MKKVFKKIPNIEFVFNMKGDFEFNRLYNASCYVLNHIESLELNIDIIEPHKKWNNVNRAHFHKKFESFLRSYFIKYLKSGLTEKYKNKRSGWIRF